MFADQLGTQCTGPIPWNLYIHDAEFAGEGLLQATVTDVTSGITDIVVALRAQMRGQFSF